MEVMAGIRSTRQGSSDQPVKKSELSASRSGNFDAFVERLLAVPHSEIKAQLDAEREAKRTKTASRASGASSKP
jgi:hypothetical protein